MANSTEMPIPGTQTPQVAPNVSQPISAPYSVPDGYTPEMAKGRLDELKQDKPWLERWLNGGPSSREAREFDALTRLAVGQQPATPAPAPDENQRAIAGLGAPAEISGYDLTNIHTPDGWLQMDDATRTLANTELLPAAKALDLSNADVAMVVTMIANPVTLSYENCENTLHRLWPGDEFAAGINDFIKVRDGNPKLREMLDRYPETLGNNPALITSIVAAYRRKEGRR
jgi:hypothetical protein